MRNDEELTQELDELTNKAKDAAEELCKLFEQFIAIDPGTPETDEEKKKIVSFSIELDRRRAMILRRILIEYGGFLFI